MKGEGDFDLRFLREAFLFLFELYMNLDLVNIVSFD